MEMMTQNPSIALTIDVNESGRPAPCSPYVWVIMIEGVDGCAVDVDYYPAEEARRMLREFEVDVAAHGLAQELYEATACCVRGLDRDEVPDAICLALNLYFDTPGFDRVAFTLRHDIDFALTTAWNGHTDRFTLCAATRDLTI